MIATSRPMLITAMILAAGLHIAVFQSFSVRHDVQIAAVGAAQDVMLGNAFADMVAGVTSAIPTEDRIAPQPAMTEALPNTALQAISRTPALHAAAVVPALAAIPLATSIPALTPAATPKATPQVAAPAPPVETITAEDRSINAPLRSIRPPARPAALAPPPRQQTAPPQQPPHGTAQQTANQGAQTNRPRQAAAVSSGSDANAGPSAAASNAAVSNYPGQVMRRVSRVRRPRTNARGAANVTFRIAENGGLASVAISQSSGNAELDHAAIQVIQRAAPFPPPPSGAKTRFTVEITGR